MRRYPGYSIQCVLRNNNPVERRCCVREFRLDPTTGAVICRYAVQRDDTPSHAGVLAALHDGEEVGANWAIGIEDRHRTVEDGFKGLPNIKALRLAADKQRYRLELARHLARGFYCGNSPSLGQHRGFAGTGERIELWLQLRFCSGQLHL